MIESRCGILCSECHYKEQVGCKGCVNIDKPFWGDSCPVKSCCESKNKDHCGGCGDFACKQLSDFAYDKVQGDNGKRIEQCKKWVSETNLTPCGIDCSKECPAFGKTCKGCQEIKGEVFWAEYMGAKVCPMYDCAVNQNKFGHCGQCAKLPCKTYYECKDPSITDEQHSENIKRMVEALKARK